MANLCLERRHMTSKGIWKNEPDMSELVELVIEAHLHCCYSDRKPSHDLLDLDIFNNCPSTGANQAASNCFKHPSPMSGSHCYCR